MKKILLFGPITPPINGQSVSFTVLVDSIEKRNRIVINTTRYRSKYINTVTTVLKTIYIFTFYKIETIYFTCSRSGLGFLKEFPMLFLARIFKKKVINHLHGAVFKNFYRESVLLKPFIRYAYHNVHTSVVLLESMKDEFSDFKNMRVKIIPNFYMQDLEVEVDFSKKQKQVVYLSNLIKSKGVFEFLEAAKVILETDQSIVFKIAGAPISDNLMTAKEVKLKFYEEYSLLKEKYPKNIFYLGVVDSYNKISLLTESSVFVLPSYYPTEAFPLSIIEAMRTGNAIITTKHNFLPEIVKDNLNGKIIKIKSSENIKSSIKELFSDKEKLRKIQEYNIIESKNKYKQENYTKSLKEMIFSNN